MASETFVSPSMQSESRTTKPPRVKVESKYSSVAMPSTSNDRKREPCTTEWPSIEPGIRFHDLPLEDRQKILDRMQRVLTMTKEEWDQYVEKYNIRDPGHGKLLFDNGEDIKYSVAGHITLRDPVNPDTFWVNPFGKAFSQIKRSDLILVDHDGQVIDGGENRLLNQAAYMIHAALHKARPDVNCAAHSHSIHGRTFCTLGRTIDMTTQDSCAFYRDLAIYEQFQRIVLAKEEGERIAQAIGDKKACLLQNHGLLTCGQTIEAATFWFLSLGKCCYTQLMADAAAAGRGGETRKIDDENAEFTYQSVGTPLAGWFSALPLFDVMAQEVGDEYLQ